MSYVVYILRNGQNKLYIGYSSNFANRLEDHKTGDGSKFIRDHLGFELVYKEEYSIQLVAMRREKQLKGWTRAKKDALIAGDKVLLKKL